MEADKRNTALEKLQKTLGIEYARAICVGRWLLGVGCWAFIFPSFSFNLRDLNANNQRPTSKSQRFFNFQFSAFQLCSPVFSFSAFQFSAFLF
jgi:hypothetical protein